MVRSGELKNPPTPLTLPTFPLGLALTMSWYLEGWSWEFHIVSPQIVFTYHFDHAKLQILRHGVTANSLYLSFSPCKATSLTTWCHRKQSLLILFTMQSYKSYYMVSPETVFTYPFHRKQSLLILFTMQSYKPYCMVPPQTVFTYPLHHAKLQILLHGDISLLLLIKLFCIQVFYFQRCKFHIRMNATNRNAFSQFPCQRHNGKFNKISCFLFLFWKPWMFYIKFTQYKDDDSIKHPLKMIMTMIKNLMSSWWAKVPLTPTSTHILATH